jgi:hypothetical protein
MRTRMTGRISLKIDSFSKSGSLGFLTGREALEGADNGVILFLSLFGIVNFLHIKCDSQLKHLWLTDLVERGVKRRVILKCISSNRLLLC